MADKEDVYFRAGKMADPIAADVIAIVIRLLEEVKAEQSSLAVSIQELKHNTDIFEDALKRHAEESCNRHKQILEAFPADDIEGHRRYHESVIEWRELRNKMVREAMIKCSSAGALAGMGWLLYALWQMFKMEVHR